MIVAIRGLLAAIIIISQVSFSYAQSQDASEQPTTQTDQEVLINRIVVLLKGASQDRAGLEKGKLDALVADMEAIRNLSKFENPTDEQKAELSKLLEKVAPALASIAQSYKGDALSIAQGQIEGFTQTELDRIREICGGSFDDMLVAIQAPDQGVALAAKVGAKAEECRLLLVDARDAISKQLTLLDKSHQTLLEQHRRLEQKYADAKTPEEKEQALTELQEDEAKIKEIEEKKQQVQEVQGKVDWLAALAGIALFVVGVVVAVYGDPATGVKLMIAGGTMAEAATSPKGEQVTADVPTVRAEREGLEADKKPDQAATEALVAEFKSKGLEPISGSTEGNYVVFMDTSDKSWLVMQIDPRLIVLRIAPSKVQIQSNGPALSSMADLVEPKVMSVSPKGNVTLGFNAKLNGADVSGGITEEGVGSQKYSLTLNTGFLQK
ncbi:hypothetical protein D9M70_465370 [compost metagenome]